MLKETRSVLDAIKQTVADIVLPDACPHCQFSTVVREDIDECPWCGWGPDSKPDRTPQEARQRRLDEL